MTRESKPITIAIAGFQHETNTFVPTPTEFADFEMADSWPGMLKGEAVVKATRGMNLPVAGFAQAAMQAADVQLNPILWCAAEPSGKVSDAAFARISEHIIAGVTKDTHPDAVYLDLHGAMVTNSLQDAEGELLQRLRTLLGPKVPIVASLDMHANLTARMVDAADILTAYRTYPHLDMALTGARAFAWVRRLLRGDRRPAKAWRQGAFLIPLHAQDTDADPARSLFHLLHELETTDSLAELAFGFTAADIFDCGPSVVAYAPDQAQASAMAETLISRLHASEDAFAKPLLSPDEAVRRAMAGGGGKPVVIADVQDNPGAGASSDTTGLLRALVDHRASGAVLGLMHDPPLAAQAHAHGVGARFTAPVGGRGPGDSPLRAEIEVEALSDGFCTYTGEMYGGGVATMGPTALLRLRASGVRVVVNSIRNQCLDQAQFRHLGVRLESCPIICVKSTAHFRADFTALSETVLLAAAPGQFPCELGSVPYRNLRPNVRRG